MALSMRRSRATVSVGGPDLDTGILYAPNIIETYTRAAGAGGRAAGIGAAAKVADR